MSLRPVNWKDFLRGDPNEAETKVRAQIDAGVSPLATSRYGKTLLHVAAIMDNLPVARLAITSGVSVDRRAYPQGKGGRSEKITLGWTPLFYAVRNASYGMGRFLLDSGASEVKSVQGETPLSLALRRKSESL